MDEEFDVFNENYNSKIPGYSKKKLANENTPKSKSKGRYFDINEPGCQTLDMEHKPSFYDSNNQLHMSVSFTPKTPTCSSRSECLDSTKNEFSVTNPFESHNTIDSLLQPSFSPSVFCTNSSSNRIQETDKQCPSGFWNIDQIAILNPADIDLSLLHQQQDLVRLDHDTEKKAQMAIDEFFSSHIEMPSPWSGERPHYLALISPSPAHMKKKANLRTPGAGGSSSSATSSLSSVSQIRVRKLATGKYNRMPTHSEVGVAQNSESKPNTLKTNLNSAKSNTGFQLKLLYSFRVSTQTALTLPPSFDLQSILAQYFTYNEGGHTKKSELQSEALSTSSLRRKLFFLDGEDVKCLPEDHEHDPSPLIHDDDNEDDDCKTEENGEPPVFRDSSSLSNNRTPSSHHNMCRNIPQTPSTCQSHFSSSPLCEALKFENRTPCSGYSQRCGSGLRRRKMILGSSSGEDDLVMGDFNGIPSPQLSPVQTDNVKTKTDNIMTGVGEESLVEDESMSFRVSSCSTEIPVEQLEVVPEVVITDLPITRDESNTPPALESSRKQLLMDSPPLSPIQPIEHKSLHIKQSSSMNHINSSGNINTALHPPFSLCPSPMLSPIPCKSKAKKTIQKDPLTMVVDSPLSSTTSSIHQQSNKNAKTDVEDPQINHSGGDEDENFFSRVHKQESFSRNSNSTAADKKKLDKKHNCEQSHSLKPGNVMGKTETEAMISTPHHQKNMGKINNFPNSFPMQMQGIESDYTCLPPSKCDLTSVCIGKQNDKCDLKETNMLMRYQNMKDFINVPNTRPLCNPTVSTNVYLGNADKSSAMETSHRNYSDKTTVCIKSQSHNLQSQNHCEKEAPVNCMMDISLQHLAPDDFSECDNSAHSMNRNNLECQGDSGYTTAQSNFQTSRISTQAEY